jgi:type IV secretion system protein VirD4
MSQEIALYRTPRKPGDIGAFNWKPVLLGFLLLFGWNVAATQWVASHFYYQRALGAPLLRFPHFAVYQPFQWAMWLLRFGSSSNPDIRLPIVAGAGIVVVGTATTLLVVAYLNMRRTKKYLSGSEDLHGSAHWATSADIEDTGLIETDTGVYVGGWYDRSHERLHYLRHDGPEHILAFAPTRSGKGVGLVIPTLLAWQESVIVYDIKGENWAKTSGFRAHGLDQLCMKFSPVEDGNSSRFNPLAEIRINTKRDVSDAQNIADMLVRTGEDSAQERYWQDAAASIMTGMLLHVCYAAAEGRTATLADLCLVFTYPGSPFRDTLNSLLNFAHDPEKKRKWRTPQGVLTATHPTVREKVQEMLDKEDKDFSGVLSTAKTALTLYSDPLVLKNTAASDFTIQDLVNSHRPMSLYLVVPPSDKIRLRPLIRLIFTIIVNRLTEKMDFENGAQKTNRHRLLFMIDEFPSLKNMPVFADALSYMGGYGLKAFLITQDIRQIIDQYGPNESIVSNCQIRVAYAPNQYETAELLSKLSGTMTVERATVNYSGDRSASVMKHANTSIQYEERPLITPDEVMRLRPARKRGFGWNQKIVGPGDMLIFMSGTRPIYGTQMLYFMDPVLRERGAVEPPTKFLQIVRKDNMELEREINFEEEENKIQPQLSLIPTAHPISVAHTEASAIDEDGDVVTDDDGLYHAQINAGEDGYGDPLPAHYHAAAGDDDGGRVAVPPVQSTFDAVQQDIQSQVERG